MCSGVRVMHGHRGCAWVSELPVYQGYAQDLERCKHSRDGLRYQGCIQVSELCSYTEKVSTNHGCVHTSGMCCGFRDVLILSGDVPCARDVPAGVTGREGGPMELGPHSPRVWVGDAGGQRDLVLNEGWPFGTRWALCPHRCAWGSLGR